MCAFVWDDLYAQWMLFSVALWLDCAVFVTSIWTSYHSHSFSRSEAIQSNSMKIGWAFIFSFPLELIKLIHFKLNKVLDTILKTFFDFPFLFASKAKQFPIARLIFGITTMHLHLFMYHSHAMQFNFFMGGFVWRCVFVFTKEFRWGWKTLLKEKLENKRLINFILAKTL